MSKKKAKIKIKVKTDIDPLTFSFEQWWNKTACPKVEKIQKEWIKENEPNDPDEEEGGDYWCVNNMMHEDDPFEATYDIAKEVFSKGYNKENWSMNQADSLYCELDSIIGEAYEAGVKSSKSKKKGKK